MHRKLLLSLIVPIFIPFMLRAEWVSLNKQNTLPAPPIVTLISDDNNSTVIKIEISGFEQKNFISGDKNYQMIDLLSESFTSNPGFPELPYIAKVLAIPDQAGVSVEVLETGEFQTFSNVYLPPARESWIEGSPETAYTENTEGYNSTNAYPGEFVKLDSPSIFRDFRITRVSVFPIRYIPAKKELQVVSSVTVRINYGPGEVINPKTSAKRPIAPSFGDLYRSFIFNYQSVLNTSFSGKEEGHELMLCIMPDEFIASFQPYAEWKRQSGTDIHVTKFSDIGANASDPNIIKNHITDAYHNWDVPPTYVLIVGDNGVFPKQICSYGFPNEDFFVEIDGNDFFPELFIGRFTNESDYGLQVMTNKFLKYEITPYTADTDWFKKGICCSNNNYESQIETKRFAAKRMLENGGFTSVDTMMSDSPCTYDVSDVVAAINNGRSFLNYRGEGWSSGWWATCTPMHTPDVTGLNNGQKFTFVTSIGCGVAMFDASGGNCFGEEWIEEGTLSSPKGAAAFIGPTGNTHTAYNNNIDRGIYIGMFLEGLETPGQALVRGKLQMYNVFGNEYYVDYHYKIFCVLGDPSIHIWKDVPMAVNVNYPASIPFGNNTVEFTVTFTATGQPIVDALVCVTGTTIFSTGYTDETGKAYVDINTVEEEELNVTVRGGNVIPHKGTLDVVVPSGPYVINESYTLNDVAGGNGNGTMETSETILTSLTIKNVGTGEANNVMVTIETSDEYVTLTDSTEFYGTILVGATAVVTDGFGWQVSNNIPDLHNVIFEMTATDGIGQWTSFFIVEGHGPKIEFGNMQIEDTQGNGNGRIDPGETLDIIIPTFNNGSYQASDAVGSLSCSSGFITLNNAIYNFNDLGAGMMEEAVFNATVSPNAPVGTSVSFMYDVTSGGYYQQESFGSSIGLIVEDWETGDMSQFEWLTGGNSNWAVSQQTPYEGAYCIKSGDINDNQSNWLSIEYEAISDDSISFWYKVSSELNYDFLKFYIDNLQKALWSGYDGWERVAYAVTAGPHTFKWTYSKDGSISSGEDCGWVDFIVLPASVFQASFISNVTQVCENNTVNFFDQSSGDIISWAWTFEGGNPATSNEQNPIVLYSTPGSYDVVLTVSDGIENSTLVLYDYITVNSIPEVTLEPFDWVCIGWPAFELTGGTPAGGEYSGPGVENGWFNPAIAGIGTQTITYTYSDPNNCENFATETILVDPCTGINESTNLLGIKIYPNPTTGMITLDFDQNIGTVGVAVVNTLNKAVYSGSIETNTGNRLNLNLSNLPRGIFFVKIRTDQIDQTIKVILQ
jgi:PKD repeat protein